MNRFPHTVTVSTVAKSTYANGRWTAGAPNEDVFLVGRFEAQTNATVIGADGTVIKINGILYMPPTAPLLEVGTEVTVMDGTEQRAKASVKQFDRTRLNARAWL